LADAQLYGTAAPAEASALVDLLCKGYFPSHSSILDTGVVFQQNNQLLVILV